MKKFLLALLKAATVVFGARVVDQRTGKTVGKALFIPWRGKLRIIGLEDKRIIAAFESQTHPEPDFPNEREAHDPSDAPG
jgi:hypothetical protein